MEEGSTDVVHREYSIDNKVDMWDMSGKEL